MEKDAGWSVFLSDDKRYADFINGCGCDGQQLVTENDIKELDTKVNLKLWQRGRQRYFGKARDVVRKIVFGANFMVVGVENQESKDYSYPVRNMIYDAGEYEKQLRKLRKQVRKNRTGLRPGEYLYGFRKKDKLKPVVTFLLYAGEEPWEYPKGLRDLLDFTDIPESLQDKIQNYKINVIDIRRMKDTSVFRTDIAEVFDFIRYSNDKEKLKELVESKTYFQHMEEDAFDVAVNYSCAQELSFAKEEYEEGGRVNMCVAIQEMMKDSRDEGILEGVVQGRREGVREGQFKGEKEKCQQVVRNMLLRGMSDEDIIAIAECDKEFIDTVRSSLS
jgi:hypothetical protein